MATVRLAKTTLGSTTATVTFSGISQSYTHLELHVYAKTDVSTSTPDHQSQFTFNGNTSGYSYNFMESIPGVADNYGYYAPGGASNGLIMGLGSTASSSTSFGVGIIYIPFYKDTAIHKQAIWRAGYKNSAQDITSAGGIEWANTSAITSFTITNVPGSFLTGSTFILYAW